MNVVVATVDPELGHRGQASFIVPKDTPGLSMGKKEDKIGIRASQTAEVVLEDCRIPLENLLGGMDKLEKKLERARSGQTGGKSNALATFEITRPMVGASALGIAQAAYEWTLEYLEDKSDENGPLLEQQRVQQVLADVATEIEASRMLVWRAAWMGRNGQPMTGGQGSMSKLKAGDITMWATTTLMDLVGDVRPVHRVPPGEVVPGRQDLPDLRGHGPGPAARRGAHAARRVQAAQRQRGSARAGSRHRRRGDDAEREKEPGAAARGIRRRLRVRRSWASSFDPAVITLLVGATAPVRARGARPGRPRLRGAVLAAGRLARRHRALRDRAAVARSTGSARSC